MNSKDFTLGAITASLVFLVFYLIYRTKKAEDSVREFQQRNSNLENANRHMANAVETLQKQHEQKDKVIELLENQDGFSESFKREFDELLKSCDTHSSDSKLITELISAKNCFEIGEDTKVIFILSKTCEHVLKQMYKDDESFKEEYNKVTFHNCMSYAKDKGDISDDDFRALTTLRKIRNEEAHELGVKTKKDKSRLRAALYNGFVVVRQLIPLCPA